MKKSRIRLKKNSVIYIKLLRKGQMKYVHIITKEEGKIKSIHVINPKISDSGNKNATYKLIYSK